MEHAAHPTDRGAADAPASEPTTVAEDRAFAAIVATIEGLDDLGLADDGGRAAPEPASVFLWV